MQNYKCVKEKVIESTKPFITKKYIYTDKTIYNNNLERFIDVEIQHMSEFFDELLYITDNALYSDKTDLIASLDNNITLFSTKNKIAIGTKTETLILDDTYDVEHTINMQIDAIVWYKNSYITIVNECVVINGVEHKGSDAVFMDYYNLFVILDTVIYFVEPNGLLHNEPIEFDGSNVKLYNFDDSFIAESNGYFDLFTFENYEWRYTRFEKDGKIICVIDNCVWTHENSYVFKNHIHHNIDIISNIMYKMSSNNLSFTDFNDGYVPTPYWHGKITINDIKMFSLCNYIAMIYASNDIYFIDVRSINLIRKIELNDIINNTKDDSINQTLMHMTLKKVVVNDICLLDSKAYFLINNERLYIYDYLNEKTEKYKTSFAYLLYISYGKLYLRTKKCIICWETKNEIISDLDLKDNIKFDMHGDILIYHIKNTLTIKNNKTVIIEDVTSYQYNINYVSFIRHNYIVIIDLYLLNYQIYNKNEPQQTLLLMNKNLISYVKRGNFEIIKPRIFIRKQIKDCINQRNYKEALKLCAQNCINYNIFMNIEVNLTQILDSAVNVAQIINFVVQIYNSYGSHVYVKQDRYDILDVISNLDYKNGNYELQTEALKFICSNKEDTKNFATSLSADTSSSSSMKSSIENKIHVCESKEVFLSCAMQSIDKDCVRMKIYSNLNMIDKSLAIVKTNLEYLKDLRTIVNDEDIIKNALATYDLCFAIDAIRYLQKDLYVDFINSIQSKYSIEQRISINKTIDKKETVLFYMVQNEEEQECDILNYITKNHLEVYCHQFHQYMKTGELSSFNFLNCFDSILHDIKEIAYARIYADSIYNTDKSKSIELYYELNDFKKIFEIYCELKEYLKACEVNKSYIQSDEFYDIVICFVINESNYGLVAQIYESFKNDNENAYIYYLKDKKYKDAKRLKDLPSDYTINDKKEIKDSCERMEYLIDRINNIKNKVEQNGDMTMSFSSRRSSKSTKSKLRDKVGSRYEKEWCMDQIRLLIESILKIKQAYIEINEDSIQEILNDFRDKYFKFVDEIFNTENIMHDPERPIIERPEIEKL